MRPRPHHLTNDASREVVELLVEAFGRAIRRGDPAVGTEHLLYALLDGESAAREVMAPGMRATGSLMGIIKAKGVEFWATEDVADDTAATFTDDLAVTALLREAAWNARTKAERRSKEPLSADKPLPTEALVDALGQALVHAHERGLTWANTTHLLIGLLHDPRNRASETLVEQWMDREEIISELAEHPSAQQDGTPHVDSVNGLRNTGLLAQPSQKFWAGLARVLSSGGFGSPILPTMHRESRRQAARLGHPKVTTVHLLLAMLVLDEQLTATGHQLRDDLVQNNTGADLLRSHGVTLHTALTAATEQGALDQPLSDQPTPEEGPDIKQVMLRARLRANERKAPSTGTTHLLTELLADSDGPCAALLAAIGVDTAELRQALSLEPSTDLRAQ